MSQEIFDICFIVNLKRISLVDMHFLQSQSNHIDIYLSVRFAYSMHIVLCLVHVSSVIM